MDYHLWLGDRLLPVLITLWTSGLYRFSAEPYSASLVGLWVSISLPSLNLLAICASRVYT